MPSPSEPACASSIADALDAGGNRVISLVGAGGKTSLLFALARTLEARACAVVTTTTTRIYPPTPEQSSRLLLVAHETDPVGAVAGALARSRHVTVASDIVEDKLRGVAPSLVDRLDAERVGDAILVEADGAAGRPLKAAREGEPVFPASSTLVVAVVGIDALGKPLDERWVFRSALAAEITGLRRGDFVTADAVVELLIGARGVTAHAPRTSRLVVYVNKVEADVELRAGHHLARRLFSVAGRRLSRVVLGSLNEPGRGFAVLEP